MKLEKETTQIIELNASDVKLIYDAILKHRLLDDENEKQSINLLDDKDKSVVINLNFIDENGVDIFLEEGE